MHHMTYYDKNYQTLPRCDAVNPASARKDYINLHVGQAGIQIGNAFWELLGLEHGIAADGSLRCDSVDVQHQSMYVEHQSCRYTPRALFIDTEPNVIDEIRTGAYRNLFNSEQLLSHNNDSANNYMKGRYGFCKTFLPIVVNNVRKLSERSGYSTVLLSHSTGGGTGSGFTVSMLEQLEDYIGLKKMEISELVVCPPKRSCSALEILNHVLYMYESQPHIDMSLMISNDAIYNIFSRHLLLEQATLADTNRFIAPTLSNLTAGDRFSWIIDSGFSSLRLNLLPFRNMKYLSVGYSPVVSISGESKYVPDIKEALTNAFLNDFQLTNIDLQCGTFMACSATFRGENLTPNNVVSTVQQVKAESKMNFVDWSPIGLKIGLVGTPLLTTTASGVAKVPFSVSVLSNHTDMATLFDYYTEEFDNIVCQNFYTHWLEQEYEKGCLADIMHDAVNFQEEMTVNYATAMGTYDTQKCAQRKVVCKPRNDRCDTQCPIKPPPKSRSEIMKQIRSQHKSMSNSPASKNAPTKVEKVAKTTKRAEGDTSTIAGRKSSTIKKEPSTNLTTSMVFDNQGSLLSSKQFTESQTRSSSASTVRSKTPTNTKTAKSSKAAISPSKKMPSKNSKTAKSSNKTPKKDSKSKTTPKAKTTKKSKDTSKKVSAKKTPNAKGSKKKSGGKNGKVGNKGKSSNSNDLGTSEERKERKTSRIIEDRFANLSDTYEEYNKQSTRRSNMHVAPRLMSDLSTSSTDYNETAEYNDRDLKTFIPGNMSNTSLGSNKFSFNSIVGNHPFSSTLSSDNKRSMVYDSIYNCEDCNKKLTQSSYTITDSNLATKSSSQAIGKRFCNHHNRMLKAYMEKLEKMKTTPSV